MEHVGTVELETHRLMLRRYTPDDAHECWQCWAGDARAYRYISAEPISEIDIIAGLAGVADAYSDLQTYIWAVCERETGMIVGEVSVSNFSMRNMHCEVDYIFGPAYWGRGYATEAVRAVIDFLFEMGVVRVQAKCFAGNAGSMGVMRKCGMRREGVLRNFFLRKDADEFGDVAVYSVLRDEWAATQMCNDKSALNV